MPAESGNAAVPMTGVDESVPRFVDTPEGRLSWLEAGAPVEDAVPLVLLHGFTGHRDDFIGLAAALGTRRRVLAPDLRGHGDGPKAPGRLGWGFDQLVADLTAFLDARGLARVDLLGHSVGGFVALRFALAHPERVRSLVFVCTAPEPPATMDPAGWRKAAAIAAGRGMEVLEGAAERVTRADPFPGLAAWGDPERYHAHHRRRLLSMTPESYAGIGGAFFDAPSLAGRLAAVEVPTLVVVGDLDRDWLAGADLFERLLPNARRVTIAGAEHHPHQERPQAFLEALESHLAAVRAADDRARPATPRTRASSHPSTEETTT